jgi:ZIP family zinc transporter
MQGFAAGLMLCISFLDLAHNAINSIGFLKGTLWVSYIFPFLHQIQILLLTTHYLFIYTCHFFSLTVQFFGGVVFFGIIANFIPEPTLTSSLDVKSKKVLDDTFS